MAAMTKARINEHTGNDDQRIHAPKQQRIKYLLSLHPKASLVEIVSLFPVAGLLENPRDELFYPATGESVTMAWVIRVGQRFPTLLRGDGRSSVTSKATGAPQASRMFDTGNTNDELINGLVSKDSATVSDLNAPSNFTSEARISSVPTDEEITSQENER